MDNSTPPFSLIDYNIIILKSQIFLVNIEILFYICYDFNGDFMKIDSIKFKNFIKYLLIIFLFFNTVWIQRLIVNIFHIKKITTTTSTMLNLTSNVIFLIFLILIYRKDLIKDWKTFTTKFSDNMETGIKYWLLGTAAMMASNILIGLIFGGGKSNNEEILQHMIKAVPIFMIINAGIIGPINEELIFRRGLKNVFNNKYLFILISGIVFGLAHITSANTLKQFLFVIPYSCLGISFALMYYKSKTIYTSMFIHMIHNTILIISSIFMYYI